MQQRMSRGASAGSLGAGSRPLLRPLSGRTVANPSPLSSTKSDTPPGGEEGRRLARTVKPRWAGALQPRLPRSQR